MGIFKSKPKPTTPKIESSAARKERSYRVGYAQGQHNEIRSYYDGHDAFFGRWRWDPIPDGEFLLRSHPAVDHLGKSYEELVVVAEGIVSTPFPAPGPDLDRSEYLRGLKDGLTYCRQQQKADAAEKDRIARLQAEAAQQPWRDI